MFAADEIVENIFASFLANLETSKMIEIRSAFNPIDYFTELTPKSDDEKPVKKVSY